MRTRQSDRWQAAGGRQRRRRQVPRLPRRAPLKLLPRLAGRLCSSALSYRSTELLLGRLAMSPCDVRRPAIAAGPPIAATPPADRRCGVQGRRQPPPGDRVSVSCGETRARQRAAGGLRWLDQATSDPWAAQRGRLCAVHAVGGESRKSRRNDASLPSKHTQQHRSVVAAAGTTRHLQGCLGL